MCQLATIICAGIGLFLSGIAAFSCDFVAGTQYFYHDSGFGSGSVFRGVGFLGRSRYGTLNVGNIYTRNSVWCESFSNQEKDLLWDDSWKAGMAMAIIAFSFGVFAFFGSLLFCCNRNIGKKGYTCLTCLYLFTMICQGLSLVALNSQLLDIYGEGFGGQGAMNLYVGPGAGCAIAATVIWMICACTSVCTGKELAQDEDEAIAASANQEPLLNEEGMENA